MLMASGGNIKTAKAGAKVEIARKSALVAIDVPNAPSTPKDPFEENRGRANTIDEAVSKLDVSFKVKLQKMDGTNSREKIAIQTLDDFDEAKLVQQSEALLEQRRQMLFLHDFQEELNNEGFREELKELLASDKKDKLLAFLKGWSAQLKKPQSRFIELLKAGV